MAVALDECWLAFIHIIIMIIIVMQIIENGEWMKVTNHINLL